MVHLLVLCTSCVKQITIRCIQPLNIFCNAWHCYVFHVSLQQHALQALHIKFKILCTSIRSWLQIWYVKPSSWSKALTSCACPWSQTHILHAIHSLKNSNNVLTDTPLWCHWHWQGWTYPEGRCPALHRAQAGPKWVSYFSLMGPCICMLFKGSCDTFHERCGMCLV